jgi:hypothetical protein
MPRAPTMCGAPRGIGKLAGAFPEARVLAGCEIALRAPAGWYVLSTAGLPGWAAFLNNGDRYASEITSIAPSADRASVLCSRRVRYRRSPATSAGRPAWRSPMAGCTSSARGDLVAARLHLGARRICAGGSRVGGEQARQLAAHRERVAVRRADQHGELAGGLGAIGGGGLELGVVGESHRRGHAAGLGLRDATTRGDRLGRQPMRARDRRRQVEREGLAGSRRAQQHEHGHQRPRDRNT